MMNNAGTMRHVVIVIIALLALSIFMPTIWAKSTGSLLLNSTTPKTTSAYTPVITTPSMAAFLNDSWVPSSFVPPTINATLALKNGTLKNSTYSIYDFANDNWMPQTASAVAANNAPSGKGPSDIYQVLNSDWTPATPVTVVQTSPYKMHQMN